MDHSPFAGLTIIEPGDSPWDDGGSFYSRNPQVIDRLLRLVFTGTHDEHAPLVNPTVAPTVVANATGGQLPPDTDVFVTFTAIDADGGETIGAPAAQVTTAAGLGAPTAQFTATPDYSAGSLPANLYDYALTVVDAAGNESAPSDPVEVSVDSGNVNAQVQLAGFAAIVAALAGTEWHLYRSVNGGDYGFLDAGTTDAYTDDGTGCADLQLPPPDDTGAAAVGGTASVTVTVDAADLPAGTVNYRIYAAPTSDFPDPALVGEFVAADAGTAHVIVAFDQTAGSPPIVSTSLGGMSKLLATRDIDWTGWTGGGGGATWSLLPPDELLVAPGGYTWALLARYGLVAYDSSGVGQIALVPREFADQAAFQGYVDDMYQGFNADAKWAANFAPMPLMWDAANGVTVMNPGAHAENADVSVWRNDGFALFGPYAEVDFTPQSDNWTRVGVQLRRWDTSNQAGVNPLGLAGYVDRAAGTLVLAKMTDDDPFTVTPLATLGAADGYAPPAIGDDGFIFLWVIGKRAYLGTAHAPTNARFVLSVDLSADPDLNGSAVSAQFYGGVIFRAADDVTLNFTYYESEQRPTATALTVYTNVWGGVHQLTDLVTTATAPPPSPPPRDALTLTADFTTDAQAAGAPYAAAWRDAETNIVSLGGRITPTAAAVTAIGSLPAGWHPEYDTPFTVWDAAGNRQAITVHADGTITRSTAGTDVIWLDGITYRALAP